MIVLDMNPATMPAEARALYETMAARRKSHGEGFGGPYLALLNHPELARRVEELGFFLKFEGALPRTVYQFIVLTVARATGAGFEWHDHIAHARAAGLPADVIDCIGTDRAAALRQPYALAHAILAKTMAWQVVPDDLQAQAVAAWGKRGLVEIVVLSGFYQMFAAINQGSISGPTAELRHTHYYVVPAQAGTTAQQTHDPMPATPADLFAFLDRLGIAHSTVTHPALFTVEQSQALRGTIPGGHTKNLFLRDKKGALYLVTALEDAAIELKSLHRLLQASGRFSFGSAELMRTTLGIEPGAVTPFAAMNDTEQRVSVVLDAAMMRHETLNYHPLVNTMTTSIARGDLVRFLEATGHPPRIVAVAVSGDSTISSPQEAQPQ